MTKLSQILAIATNKKTLLHKGISDLHHQTQKPDLLNGHHKVYSPKDEDGETFPDDVKRVQVHSSAALEQVSALLTTLMDVTATKDFANCEAKADIVVDGNVFIEGVPVPHLLFLEKELHDLHEFVTQMVELEPGENWAFDANSGQHRSDTVKTQRTKKLQKPIVLYPATPEHPAQTQLITEDVVIGTWATTKFSGAIPRPKKLEYLERITKLEDAVKFAREQANSIEVTEKKHGQRILAYVFAGSR